jgi:hypothetical protein
VTGLSSPHVLVGAPGCPVVGVCIALAGITEPTVNATTQNVPASRFRTSLLM